MLHREIYLIVNNIGGRIGEFLVELNFDQPGILAALSNVFADSNANILNIAIDSARTKMHFIVDVSAVDEPDLRDLSKRLGMFAFVKKVLHRIVEKRIFVPRWLVHVVNNEPAFIIEREFFSKAGELDKLAVEMAKRDVEVVKGAMQNGDLEELHEAVYLIQLRGLGTVQGDDSTDNAINIKYCKIAYPIFRRYVDIFLSSISNRGYRVIEEGSCVRIQIA